MKCAGTSILNNTAFDIQIWTSENLVDSIIKPIKKVKKLVDPLRVRLIDGENNVFVIKLSDVCCQFETLRALGKFLTDNAAITACENSSSNQQNTVALSHNYKHFQVGGIGKPTQADIPKGAISFNIVPLVQDPNKPTARKFTFAQMKATTLTDIDGNEISIGLLASVGSNDGRTGWNFVSTLPVKLTIKTNGAAAYVSYLLP
ncbi:MAG: hypothetical protein ACPG5B_02285 [Chitinophagales bacterium]